MAIKNVYAGANYSENFDDGVAQGWTTVNGTWSVANGYYSESDSIQNAITIYNNDTWSTGFSYSVSLYSQWGSSGNTVAAIYNYQNSLNYYEARFSPTGTATLIKVVGGTETTVDTKPYSGGGAGNWLQVKIDRSGQNTSVSVNGASVFSNVPQTEFSTGKIGAVAHWDLARIDNVSVTTSYSENFDTNTATGWTANSGTWNATGGYYSETKSPVEQNAVSVYTGGSFNGDFSYSARVYSQYGGTGNFVGVIYNYQNAQNYYEARFNTQGTAWLYKIAGGVETQVDTATIDAVGATHWFLVQVVRQGQNTTVYVNTKVAFMNESQTEYTGGTIGLAAHWDQARFDDIVVTSGGKYKTTYPKLSGVFNAGPFSDLTVPSYQQALAKLDMAVIYVYPGFNSGHGRDAVQQIKAYNPRMLLGNYTIFGSAHTDNDASQIDVQNKLYAEKGPNGIGDWWARDNQGTMKTGFGYTYMKDTNITDYVTPDANGDRFPQWFAKREYQKLFGPIPEFDIWFTDNTVYKPRMSADWNRDGTNDNPDNATVAANYRKGFANHWNTIRSLEPGVLIMGNVDGEGSTSSGYLREPEYRSKIEAAFFEAAIGEPAYSEEAQNGWATMMDSYQSLIDNTSSPHLVIFNVHGDHWTGADPNQLMRYGLASALMSDGYYSYTVGYHNPLWFEEYEIPLGTAVDPPHTGSWSNAVYMRKFQNGLVVVNPTSSQQTVTVPAGYRHFAGQVAPNDGLPVSTVTLQPRDGVLLVKQ